MQFLVVKYYEITTHRNGGAFLQCLVFSLNLLYFYSYFGMEDSSQEKSKSPCSSVSLSVYVFMFLHQACVASVELFLPAEGRGNTRILDLIVCEGLCIESELTIDFFLYTFCVLSITQQVTVEKVCVTDEAASKR